MKTIRLGIIGCGGFVRFHTGHIKDHVPELRIVALCDIIEQHATKLKSELPPDVQKGVNIYLNYRDMLRKEKLDAVHVSTPHTLHFTHAYGALSAGRHVMVDKPMVTNSAQARKLVAKARQMRKHLSVAIQGTHTDTFAYSRQLLSDGTLGKQQLVSGILAQGWMKGTVGRWRQDPALSGGGQLYDSCAHVIGSMLYLVNSDPVEVFCWADNCGCKVDINAVACLKFANGCMGTITSGGNCNSWRSHLIFQCEHAKLEISPHGGDFSVQGRKDNMSFEMRSVPRNWKVPGVTPARNFADAILGKAKLRCTGELGIRMADLMDGIYASVRTGKPVKLRAKKS
jgi:predicted dehydrogenase